LERYGQGRTHNGGSLKYRPEIDGLRAIAVLSVALYHGGLSLLSGGFVGVDIFFVISGFLITSIIYDQVIAARFSFADFYWRRFRRIMPAFVFMVLVVSLVGYKIMDPVLYADFGDSLWTASVFSANIFFWTEAGYFQTAAKLKPLLHTWSLGVEEQYYIFIPILILLVVKYRRKYLFATLCLIGVCSFILSVWGVENKPIATFYLLPTRLWELLLGSLLAVKSPPLPQNRTFIQIIQWVAFALLLTPVFYFTEKTPFPGIAALLPCLGVALIIWSTAGQSSPLTRLLSLRPINLVGRVSYSFYLWHWPILILAEYSTFDDLTLARRMLLLLLAFAISWFSWRYVERPFRENLDFFSKARTLRLSAASVLVFSALGVYLSVNDGISSRFVVEIDKLTSAAQRKYVITERGCDNPRWKDTGGSALCLVGKQIKKEATFVLWGDSHAKALAPAFDEGAKELGFTGYVATWDGCPPFLGIDRIYEGMKHNCLEDRKLILELIENSLGIDTVVIARRWPGNIEGRFFGHEEHVKKLLFEYKGQKVTDVDAVTNSALRSTIDWLHENGKRVVLIGPVPEVGVSVPEMLIKQVIWHTEIDIRPDPKALLRGKSMAFELLASVANIPAVTVLYPHKRLCSLDPAGKCSVVHDGYPLYFDDDHLSTYGAMYLVDMAEQALVPAYAAQSFQ